ncbi:MAG: type VI secretion system baseplate subunit TssG [Lautropia sp.]
MTPPPPQPPPPQPSSQQPSSQQPPSHQPPSYMAFLEALRQAPVLHDFYQAMRRIEAAHPQLPRLGEARRPAAEPVRLGQQPDLDFAPANVTRVEPGPSGLPRLFVRFLGLFGPQGPLPLHLTELARERERSHGDATFARFADLFHHRMLLLFFRAWRQAQPTATHDRAGADRYRTYVGALLGHGSPAWQSPAAPLGAAKRHYAGHLSRAARHPDGLAALLADDLQAPVAVHSFVPRWLTLPRSQRTALGVGESAVLGRTAVVGARVFDAQHHFDLAIGPVDYPGYQRLLPGGSWHARVREWVREYTGDEFGARMVPRLHAAEVPPLRLGMAADRGPAGRLGWDAWLGRRRSIEPAADLALPVATVPAP